MSSAAAPLLHWNRWSKLLTLNNFWNGTSTSMFICLVTFIIKYFFLIIQSKFILDDFKDIAASFATTGLKIISHFIIFLHMYDTMF